MGTPLPVLTWHSVSHPRALSPPSIQASAQPRGLTVFDQELIPPRIHPSRMPLLSLPLQLLPQRSLLLILPQSRLESRVPHSLRHAPVQLILLMGDQMRVRDSRVCGFQDRSLVSWLADDLNRGVCPGLDVLPAEADVGFVGEARGAGEDASGVDAVELAGFGGGVEDLREGHAVDGEIVDGFVDNGWLL